MVKKNNVAPYYFTKTITKILLTIYTSTLRLITMLRQRLSELSDFQLKVVFLVALWLYRLGKSYHVAYSYYIPTTDKNYIKLYFFSTKTTNAAKYFS